MHWAQNMVERHQHYGQCRFFGDTEYVRGLSTADLKKIVRDNGREMKTLMSKMQTYSANINGSASYLYNNRKNLEYLMDIKGMCSMWFTLTAADNHWNELHRILRNGQPEPGGNEEEKARRRRKLVRENPHIVDEFFELKAQELVKTVFGKQGLEIEWWWFRVEYQKRGTAHVHGCLRFADAPELTTLAQKVKSGRICLLYTSDAADE